MDKGGRVDLSSPRWDQSTFSGRFRHFLAITDTRLLFKSDKELDKAIEVVSAHNRGEHVEGYTADQLWAAKHLVDSAIHPDTGEKMWWLGSMSFQVPGGMLITGAMLAWYKTFAAVFFWQWVNQSFNAVVNYTNRNAKSTITDQQVALAYTSATAGATSVALVFRNLTKRAPPLLQRYAPFAAVAAANCINIPLMRQRELLDGILVTDEHGEELGYSRKAAKKAVAQVCFSRITMAAPGMLFVPIVMELLEKKSFYQRARYLNAPIQTLLVGMSLCVMVPFGCSLFPQKSTMDVKKLEPRLQKSIAARPDGSSIRRVFYNKGL
ncbi:sideroflexin-2-like [Sycon ciliatum]|uniref:sideroflexin-2-like n=1 Tax=Sycon ciliatum TaxID=27933 RepID=UPI0031F68615|eukprot:scpid67626/ scgid7379/ Sideroflexin-1